MQLKLKHIINLIFVIGAIIFFCSACKISKKSVTATEKNASAVATTPLRFSQFEQMTIDNAFLEGTKLMLIEDYSSALDVFFDVLRMDAQHAAATFQISKIRLMQNRTNEAEIYAEKAHRLAPENKFYIEHLAYLYRHNNKENQAAKCFELLVRKEPKNQDYWLELANSYLMTQKVQDAVKIYDTIEKRQGVTDEISLQKIKIYQALRNENKMREELQKLIQKFPNEIKYRSILAELEMHAKNYPEAFSEYQKMLTITPENPYIHLALAEYYKAMKDSAKAMNELKQAFKNPELDINAKIAKLLPYYERPEYKIETDSLLNILILNHPKEPKALALFADFRYRDKQFEEARTKYEAVNQIDSSKYAIWEQLLFCDLNLMDSSSLLRHAQEALSLFPEQPIIYYMLGTAYSLKTDYLMAMQYYEQGMLLTSEKNLLIQFHCDLGDVYHRLKNYEKSDQNFRKALQIDPKNTIVLNNFSYYLSERKENLPEAEQMARQACQENPTNPTYLDTFAWVLYQQGKYKEAKNIMEEALRQGGTEDAIYLEHFGDILWKNNEKEEAVEQWKQAKTLNENGASDILKEKIKTETLIEK